MIKPIKFKDLYVSFLMIYFLCLPLGALSIGAFGSVLRYLAVIPIGISFFSKKRINFNAPFLFYTSFVVFSFFSIMWSIDFNVSVTATTSQFMLLLLLFSGLMFEYDEKDTEKLKKSLAWGSRLSAILVIIFGTLISGRFVLNGVITENPNYFCSYFICGLIYALEIIITKNKISLKVLSVAELLIYITLILLTGSRGGLLSTAVGIFAFIIFSGKRGQKRVLTKLLVFIGIVVVVMFIIEQLPDILKSRFSVGEVVESGGTGRTDIWKNAINSFMNSNVLRQLFGFGAGTIYEALVLHGFAGADSHNAFIGNLLTLGVVGLSFYVASIFGFIKKALRFESKFAVAVVFAIFAFTFAASASTLKPYFNIMLYIIICLNVEKNELNNEVTKQ